MAARRLIVVLALLLAASVAAAAILPDRRGGSTATTSTSMSTTSTSTSTTSTSAGIDAGGTGEALGRRIVASEQRPPTVRAAVGDQLNLTVASDAATEIEIEALGLIANASENSPARFDLLLRERGMLAITDAANGGLIGRLVVSRPQPAGTK